MRPDSARRRRQLQHFRVCSQMPALTDLGLRHFRHHCRQKYSALETHSRLIDCQFPRSRQIQQESPRCLNLLRTPHHHQTHQTLIV